MQQGPQVTKTNIKYRKAMTNRQYLTPTKHNSMHHVVTVRIKQPIQMSAETLIHLFIFSLY